MLTLRRTQRTLVGLCLLFIVAGWIVRGRDRTADVLSVSDVVTVCKAAPSSVLTPRVRGYPVLAIAPSVGKNVNYGTLYAGRNGQGAAIELWGSRTARPHHAVVPRFSPAQRQGRIELELHGQVTCSTPPHMEVDSVSSP